MHLSFMSWVCPTWDLERMADFAAETPYDGVEFRTGSGHEHGLTVDSSPAERERAVELFADRGVEIPAVATGAELATPDDEERAAEVADAKANAELAGDLGADILRVFAGHVRDEMTPDAAADTADALTEVGEFAADHGVTPVLETMHDIVTSPADAYAVLDLVETDNVGVLWNRPTIDAEQFEAIRDDVLHVHLHDAVLDPEYEGIIAMMDRFGEAGYDGYFSLEIIRGEDLSEQELTETAERLRRYAEGAA